MNDNTFKEKFNIAWEFKKQKRYEEAMFLYSELYKQLIKDAFVQIGDPTESEKDDQKRVNNYLKGDNLACTILNNMAVILAESGNVEGAKNYFNLSIKLTPTDVDYYDPIRGLSELEK